MVHVQCGSGASMHTTCTWFCTPQVASVAAEALVSHDHGSQDWAPDGQLHFLHVEVVRWCCVVDRPTVIVTVESKKVSKSIYKVDSVLRWRLAATVGITQRCTFCSILRPLTSRRRQRCVSTPWMTSSRTSSRHRPTATAESAYFSNGSSPLTVNVDKTSVFRLGACVVYEALLKQC